MGTVAERHLSFGGKMIAMGPLVKTRFEIRGEEPFLISPDTPGSVCIDATACNQRKETQMSQEQGSRTRIGQNLHPHT